MKLQAILFDLDGTLLPMDTDRFTLGYLHMLFKRLEPYGYNEKTFISAMWQGVAAMVKNDTSRLNEAVFWEAFEIFSSITDIPFIFLYFLLYFFSPHKSPIVRSPCLGIV